MLAQHLNSFTKPDKKDVNLELHYEYAVVVAMISKGDSIYLQMFAQLSVVSKTTC